MSSRHVTTCWWQFQLSILALISCTGMQFCMQKRILLRSRLVQKSVWKLVKPPWKWSYFEEVFAILRQIFWQILDQQTEVMINRFIWHVMMCKSQKIGLDWSELVGETMPWSAQKLQKSQKPQKKKKSQKHFWHNNSSCYDPFGTDPLPALLMQHKPKINDYYMMKHNFLINLKTNFIMNHNYILFHLCKNLFLFSINC